MRVGLLGTLEVLDDDGAETTIAGAKLRSLVAVLALHVGRVVPADQLVDALWGGDPPTAVRNGLQGLVSKLRRALGSADLVVMRGDGYVLDLPPEAIDVGRFERRAAEGRALAATGELARAVEVLVEADSMWRGEALAEFAYEDFAVPAITRLSESRVALLEERLGLELALGRHQRAVVELEDLVARHPLREGLRGLLMMALYRSGRQADALRVFREGRQLLIEELGLEPGPELRRLESAILAQDPDLALASAPDRTRPPGSHPGIPAALTSLVGRDAELHDLRALFAEQRFVTLVGPGGVGKTRLAVEVGRAAATTLTSGGCLVELAPVGDPAGVPTAIAAALGVTDPNRLAEVIGDQDMVVVLDNCEHVIGAAAQVAEGLLRRCPGLRLLATSREALRVGGETVWPVPPLAPDDAVQLFVARVGASGASVGIGDAQLGVVADICARLDGLPLAIELAAARTRAFPLAQIAARLDDRFRLLTGGSRTALPRQQTLRAVVDWSYELLFGDEQRIFERLCVLPGGCDLATAEAVCVDEDLPAVDVADHLRALVDKSLVVAVPVGDGVRFSLLQTLADYGRERLTERGDAGRVRDAMARHFADLCAQSAAAYTGDGQRAWLTAMDADHDNLRAALEWAIANDDAETAMLIAGGAAWPHWLTGMIVEGRRWLDDAFACRGVVDERTRALALTGRGLLDFLAGVTRSSDDDLATALEIFERHGDVQSMVLAYSFYAEQAAVRGDLDEARRRRLVLLDLYGAAPEDPFARAARTYSLAKLALLDGDLVAAERHYRAATEGFGRLDRPVMSSICLGMVADFDELAGDYPAAIRTLEAAIATNEELLGGFTGVLQARLGWVLLHDGQLEQAATVYRCALDAARRVRHTMALFQAQAGMAAVHRVHGRDGDAVDAATEALALYDADRFPRFRNRIDPTADLRACAALCCEVLAVIAAERAEFEQAAMLLRRADMLCNGPCIAVPSLLQRDVAQARTSTTAALGAEALHAR
jgi:predicted ATPase/DNA-binding SARP family transcriptional activator/tetratricopeptide (TPR) repeat protein